MGGVGGALWWAAMSTAGRREVWERTNQCYMAFTLSIKYILIYDY